MPVNLAQHVTRGEDAIQFSRRARYDFVNPSGATRRIEHEAELATGTDTRAERAAIWRGAAQQFILVRVTGPASTDRLGDLALRQQLFDHSHVIALLVLLVVVVVVVILCLLLLLLLSAQLRHLIGDDSGRRRHQRRCNRWRHLTRQCHRRLKRLPPED